MILNQRQLERMGLDDEAPKKKGGRYTQSAFPGGPTKPLVRFGAKHFRGGDNLSTAPAPGPKGGRAADDIAWAAQRRREERERERAEGRR